MGNTYNTQPAANSVVIAHYALQTSKRLDDIRTVTPLSNEEAEALKNARNVLIEIAKKAAQ